MRRRKPVFTPSRTSLRRRTSDTALICYRQSSKSTGIRNGGTGQFPERRFHGLDPAGAPCTPVVQRHATPGAIPENWLNFRSADHRKQTKTTSLGLDYYLDEFTFRFNRRTSRSRGMLFYRLLQQAVALPPVRGEELVGGRPLTKSPYPQHLGVRGVKCIPR